MSKRFKHFFVSSFILLGLLVIGCENITQSSVEESISESQLPRNTILYKSTSGDGCTYTLKLTAGRILCVNAGAYACERHEWRATFESLILDSDGVNMIDDTNWSVSFSQKKVYSGNWGPIGDGCPPAIKGLTTIDGEWSGNTNDYVLVKANFMNTQLDVNEELIFTCIFPYDSNGLYNCENDYVRGIGVFDEYTVETIDLCPDAPVVSIDGTSHVWLPGKYEPSFTRTWLAIVSEGTTPYNYEWRRQVNGGSNPIVSTSSSYSRTYSYSGDVYNNVLLSLKVTDNNGFITTSTKTVIEESREGGI